MAENVIEKVACTSCGTEVREGSSFCYSCGEPVSGKPTKAKSKRSRKGSKNGRPVKETNRLDAEEPQQAIEQETQLVEQPAETLAEPIAVEEPVIEDKPAVEESVVEDRPKLRSAASMRRRTRTFERKPVEVMWVEREKPSWVFIIVSLVIVGFAVMLLALALYLK
jgi:hypothetical protein